MGTKEIIQALICGFCEELLKLDAAKRLEEPEERLREEANPTTADAVPLPLQGRQGWISMKDRKPENGVAVLAYRKKERGMTVVTIWNSVEPERLFSHWMPLPEPPKPKEPTFKDVFLKAFPKANIDMIGCIICVRSVFAHIEPDMIDCAKYRCPECWNQPYFEEEGEADA